MLKSVTASRIQTLLIQHRHTIEAMIEQCYDRDQRNLEPLAELSRKQRVHVVVNLGVSINNLTFNDADPDTYVIQTADIVREITVIYAMIPRFKANRDLFSPLLSNLIQIVDLSTTMLSPGDGTGPVAVPSFPPIEVPKSSEARHI